MEGREREGSVVESKKILKIDPAVNWKVRSVYCLVSVSVW